MVTLLTPSDRPVEAGHGGPPSTSDELAGRTGTEPETRPAAAAWALVPAPTVGSRSLETETAVSSG
ncbi:hypothetical protein [Natronorubrum sp. FCH18a]|uniref:hypothetical protein n=1 Tax=Natronorubrum sp. FCH18a TaxID=3447018 RepID=UPI003F5144AF